MTPINAPEDVLHTAELPIMERSRREAEQRVAQAAFDHREALLPLRSENRGGGGCVTPNSAQTEAERTATVAKAHLKMQIFLPPPA